MRYAQSVRVLAHRLQREQHGVDIAFGAERLPVTEAARDVKAAVTNPLRGGRGAAVEQSGIGTKVSGQRDGGPNPLTRAPLRSAVP